jgi:flagellin
MLSVNTNVGANIALQALNQTASDLQTTQNRISTGLAISGPKDNAAIFSIAQNMRAQVNGYKSVTQSLNNASSVTDVAIAAGQSVSDLLTQLKQTALSAADPSIDSSSLAALQSQYDALVSQITSVTKNASFNGTNIIDSNATDYKTGGIKALTNTDGSGQIAVASVDWSSASGGALQSISGATLVAGGTTAAANVDTALSTVNSDLATLGSGAKQFELQKTFVAKLSDTLNQGIGNLVDADMAKESANLQALQVKQQLGVQALSIANQTPTILLSLFR